MFLYKSFLLFPFAAPDFPPESHRMWDLRCCAAGRAHWSPFGTGGALKCSVGFPPQALISGELDILKDWCYEAVSEAPRDSPRAWDSPLEMGLFWGVFALHTVNLSWLEFRDFLEAEPFLTVLVGFCLGLHSSQVIVL